MMKHHETRQIRSGGEVVGSITREPLCGYTWTLLPATWEPQTYGDTTTYREAMTALALAYKAVAR